MMTDELLMLPGGWGSQDIYKRDGAVSTGPLCAEWTELINRCLQDPSDGTERIIREGIAVELSQMSQAPLTGTVGVITGETSAMIVQGSTIDDISPT